MPEVVARQGQLPTYLAEEVERGTADLAGRRAAAAAFADLSPVSWRRGRGWTIESPSLDFAAYDLAPWTAAERVSECASRFRDGRLLSLGTQVPNGIRVYDLRDGASTPSALFAAVGSAAPASLGQLEALNRAAYTGGVLIEVTPDAPRDASVEVEHVLTDAGRLALPRTTVVVRAGSRVRLLESVHGEGGSHGVLNAVTEVILEEGAEVDFIDLTGLGEDAFAAIRRHLRVGPRAKVRWTSGTFGGGFLSMHWKADMVGEGSSLAATGVYVSVGREQHALESRTDHVAPHTEANVVFRGAVGGRARSVFDGILTSIKEAKGTQAYLGEHVLFLSREARADAIPRLDIEGSDVRIQHGATVGRVDPEQIHYCETRGIDPDMAKEMLVMGYFEPTLARIPDETLRDAWRDEILRRVHN